MSESPSTIVQRARCGPRNGGKSGNKAAATNVRTRRGTIQVTPKRRPGGAKVPDGEFFRARADALRRDQWIIYRFGNVAIAWERFAPFASGSRITRWRI